ncbi:hypothetical protein PR202_gb26091 [Eleusine coracana subsp. coracana]|uniref:Amino acid transporter transmembrane domain-containing protein n=1 Tax=Eleusine coracana subsp. coracana TaxID=191504 RepID=A0AAV5FRQ4_ELECO|nr:hypothetical protein PR202_gb26091 [Eleusine coracana subsp. coracana]
MPSLHSLRHINLCSLIVSIGYTVLVSVACICAGVSSNAPTKDYSLSSSKSERIFNAFLSISILASVFGNSILPEIQVSTSMQYNLVPLWSASFKSERLEMSIWEKITGASERSSQNKAHATLAPPASGKMAKALVLCYSVLFLTFYFPAITGYWAFGNQVRSNVLKSLMPDSSTSLAPEWLLILAVVLVLLQLIAIALVYSQVAYELIESRSSDAARGRFSRRNLLPRLALRTAYMAACAFVAAMLPFFGEIVAVVGAVGYIPLDVVIPVLMYLMALAPARRSPANVALMVVFAGLGIVGAVASVRKLALNAGQFKLFSNGLS